MDAAALKQFEAFIQQCKSNPSLSFFRDYIDSLGRGVGGLSQFLNDREVMGAFQDPEVMAALQDVLNQSEDFIEHCKCNPSILSFSSLSSLGMIPAIPILPATATIPAIASGDSKVVDESDKKFFDCEEETRAMLGQCEEMSALLNNVVPNAHKLEEHLSLGTLNIALGLNSGEALVVMDTRGTKKKKIVRVWSFNMSQKKIAP